MEVIYCIITAIQSGYDLKYFIPLKYHDYALQTMYLIELTAKLHKTFFIWSCVISRRKRGSCMFLTE